MARTLREKVSEIKRNLFKVFCFCSAATPRSDLGEAPHLQDERLSFLVARPLVQSIAPPPEPQLGHDVRVTDQHLKVPRQHRPHQHRPRQPLPPATALPCLSEIVQSVAKAEWASILEKKSRAATASIQNNPRGAPRSVEQVTRATPASTSVEKDIQRGVPPSLDKTKITSASIEGLHVAKSEISSVSIKKTMAGKMREKAREMRRNIFKLFCSAATPNGEAPHQQDEPIAAPPQPQMSNDVKVPDQKDLTLTRDVANVIEGRPVPRQQLPVPHHQLSVPRQLVPPSGAVPCQSENIQRGAPRSVGKTEIRAASPSIENVKRGVFQSAQMEMTGGASTSTQSVKRSVNKNEIASIIEEITGAAPPSTSIHDMHEIYESIERSLNFTRRDLPVFGTSSQAAPAPRPQFVPGPAFMPRAALPP